MMIDCEGGDGSPVMAGEFTQSCHSIRMNHWQLMFIGMNDVCQRTKCLHLMYVKAVALTGIEYLDIEFVQFGGYMLIGSNESYTLAPTERLEMLHLIRRCSVHNSRLAYRPQLITQDTREAVLEELMLKNLWCEIAVRREDNVIATMAAPSVDLSCIEVPATMYVDDVRRERVQVLKPLMACLAPSDNMYVHGLLRTRNKRIDKLQSLSVGCVGYVMEYDHSFRFLVYGGGLGCFWVVGGVIDQTVNRLNGYISLTINL